MTLLGKGFQVASELGILLGVGTFAEDPGAGRHPNIQATHLLAGRGPVAKRGVDIGLGAYLASRDVRHVPRLEGASLPGPAGTLLTLTLADHVKGVGDFISLRLL